MHARRFRTEVRRLGYLVMTCFLYFWNLVLMLRTRQLCIVSIVISHFCNKALLYLTSVFSYNLDFTAGALRPCKIFNFLK